MSSEPKIKITKTGIIISIVAFFAIIITATIIHFVRENRMAKIDVLVAPASAEIKIDGKRISNGTNYVSPGTHKVEIIMSNFQPYEEEFTVSAKDYHEIHIYLTGPNGDMSWYDTHPEDAMIVNTIGGEEASKEASNYVEQDPILSITPYYDDEARFNVFADPSEDGDGFTIKVFFNACAKELIPDYKPLVEAWFKENNIDTSKYALMRNSLCDETYVNW